MHDLLHIDGKPFVLVPMHEYRRLMNGGKQPSGDLPEPVLDHLAMGKEHPVKILRKFRGMTQNELAAAASISRPYLTEIETGRKTGSIGAMQAIASALSVDVGLTLPLKDITA